MKIGIYCRFSSQNDKVGGVSSINHQKQNGIKFCKSKNYNYIVYSDLISGGILMEDRDGGSRLISDLQNDSIDGIWVDKEDRLYRDFNESTIFKYNYIKKTNKRYFIGDSEVDFDDDSNNIVNTVLSLMSDMEKKNINRRTKRGLVSSVKRGVIIGRLNYGFKRDLNGKWSIVEDEKKNIIKIHRLFVEREWETFRDWVFYCNKMIGKKSPHFYKDLFRYKTYVGVKTIYIKHIDESFEISIPKILSDNLYKEFIEKGKKLKESVKGNNSKEGFFNVLLGKVYCKECKKKLHIHKKSNGKRDRLLRCVNGGSKRFRELMVKEENYNIKPHISSFKYEFLKDTVYKSLVSILFNSHIIRNEFKKRYSTEFNTDSTQKEIKRIGSELDKISKREYTLEEGYIEGNISEDNLSKHKDKLKWERIRLEGMKLSLEDDISKSNNTNQLLRWIDEFKSEYSDENMLKKTDKEKRELINKYIDKVIVRGSKYNKDTDWEIELKLNIPIIRDSITIDKKDYWEYVNNGGKKSEWKKKFVVAKGVERLPLKINEKKAPICLTNLNFVLNLQPLIR